MAQIINRLPQGGGSSGGSSGGSGGGADEAKGEIEVMFLFCDANSNDTFTARYCEKGGSVQLPSASDTDLLVFEGWSHSKEELTNLQRSVIVGAMYSTKSGKTEMDIEITPIASTTVEMAVTKTGTGVLTIEWGDGTSYNVTKEGVNIAIPNKTYATYGNYTITMGISSGTATYGLETSGWSPVNKLAKRVRFGGNVIRLGDQSFKACWLLAQVTISKSIGNFGMRCFDGCRALSQIAIPNNVTAMSLYCFYGCFALVRISIPNSVTWLGMECFKDCLALSKVTLPNGILKLENSCFESCSAISQMVIPNGVTYIGSLCFAGCVALAKVTIPNSATSFEDSCFSGCFALREITIPANVTKVGERCFYPCYALRSCILEGSTVKATINADVFATHTDVVVYVPDNLVQAYKTDAGWRNNVSQIYPISQRIT